MGRRVTERDYYVMADVRGSVAVTITARSKREALERLSNGSWDQVWDVSLESVGNALVLEQEASNG